jgi:UDP-2-acetamido-2-deoxy-ribo-hexuluronate aminotransferase
MDRGHKEKIKSYHDGDGDMEFRDLKAQYQKYKQEIDSTIQEVVSNANFIGGKEVGELEKQLADYVRVKHCITCANGTEAMTLVMMAWDIKEGDAVFVPDFTFFSTGEVVSYRGATPVFVDVDRDTFNIDTKKLEKAIIKTIEDGRLKPKVIIPVDLFGLPADHYEIERIAKKYDLLILEDGAQGFGGNIKGGKACSFGDAATTSFFPAKPLGCYGDGGAIFTNDDNLAGLLKSLSNHGKGKDKYDNVRIGVNSRLDTIQAAILKVKLKAFVDHELEDVNRVYQLYNKRLSGIVETPFIPDGFYSSFAQYTIKLKNKDQRDGLQAKLNERGIPSMVYYVKPMHRQEAFSYLEFNEEDFEITNKLCDTILSLPMHPYLREEDIDAVCDVIKGYIIR